MAESAFEKEERGGLELWRFAAAAPGVEVFFTARSGGVSRPPYESLNLGFHVGDEPEAVRANRVRLARALGLDPLDLTSPRQRHTELVALLERESDRGSGALAEATAFDPCDGLVTTLRQAPLLLHFADCVPVVLSGANAAGPVLAVIHAGREGLMAGVIESGAARLGACGTGPESLTAAIGPCVGPCCYEVDAGMAAAFRERFGDRAATADHHLDLPRAASKVLADAGVPAAAIHTFAGCTACDRSFFSYRRDGVTGRHGAIGWIE